MKYLNLAVRFIIVGTIWSIVFATLFRSLVYGIWGFDPAFMKHWLFVWQMWRDGWVIDTPGEWFFFLSIFLFLPFWLLGWLLLGRYPWGEKFYKLIKYPLDILDRFHKKHLKRRVLVITRKKSYRKIRPPALSYVVSSRARSTSKKHSRKRAKEEDFDKIKEHMDILSGKKSRKKTKTAEYIPSSLEIDEVGDEDILSHEELMKHLKLPEKEESGLDLSAINKEEEFEQRRREEAPAWEYSEEAASPLIEINPEEEARKREEGIKGIELSIETNGFGLIRDVYINEVKVDFVGISGDRLLISIIDNVPGDWLADEERFNDEDPLWFSETSHRISPVRQLIDISRLIKEKLGFDDNYETENILIIEDSQVINAMDMVDIWEDMKVSVCRFGKGGPVSMPIFQEVIEKTDNLATTGFVSECEKVLKG